MSHFVVEYTYSDATIAGRDEHRGTHRDWLRTLVADGRLVVSGPYDDGSGALLIFLVEDEAALRALLAEDPFSIEKLIDDVRIVEWAPVLGSLTV